MIYSLSPDQLSNRLAMLPEAIRTRTRERCHDRQRRWFKRRRLALPQVRKAQHRKKDVPTLILVRKTGMTSYYHIWSVGQLFTADC